MWLSGWSQRGGLEVKVWPLGCWWLKFSSSCGVEGERERERERERGGGEIVLNSGKCL